jgi:hypothetical protein
VIWRAVVHSAIGTRHSQNHLPCQDYGHYWQRGSTIVGAVSDGAGSARYAEIGARLAVETALAELEALLTAKLGLDTSDFEPPGLGRVPFSAPQAQTLFAQVVNEVVDALKQRAVAEAWELRDLSCTLLIFIATPAWVAAMQIGDGFLVVSAAASDTVKASVDHHAVQEVGVTHAPIDTLPPQPQNPPQYQLLFSPSKGEYINETCFVTSQGAIEQMQVGIYPHPPQFICAATDGLERVALRLSDWTPFSPFFKPFEDCLRLTPDQAQDYLQTFLGSDRLNARTDDDKTLLLCFCAQKEEQVCQF